MYVDLALPPGVFANGTARQARGRWRDSNLVRSPNGVDVQPVGGWNRRGSVTLNGLARAIVAWKDNTNQRWAAIGTHEKLYVQTVTGAVIDITPAGFTAGRADASGEGGFGEGPYGAGAFGTGRPDTQDIQPASVWTLDVWGQWLLGAMAEDGKLYLWKLDAATPTPAQAVSGAPTGISGCSVSQERFIFVYRGRNIAWCDQEVETDWTPSATNQAGDQDIDTEGVFRFGRKLRGGVQLHFTEVDVWASTYLGPPFVHGFQLAGADCGAVSTGSAVAIDSRCVWMGRKSFFLYDGAVNPLPCEVADKVFSDFDETQGSKVAAHHNAKYGEVWWFYPSAGSLENDRYVLWNYRANHWWVGTLARTCGEGNGIFQNPILVDPSGVVWEHEVGFSYPAGEGALTPYARSGPVEWPSDSGLAQGDKRVAVKGFVGDEKSLGETTVTFFGREFPNTAETAFGPFAIGADPTDVMFSTRQLEIEVAFTGADDARLGVFRLDAQPVSKR